MGKKDKKSLTPQRKGRVFLSLWAVLIIAGIIGKRGFDQPDLVVFFHLPAAVFLVLAWHGLSRDFRTRNEAVLAERTKARIKNAEWLKHAPREDPH